MVGSVGNTRSAEHSAMRAVERNNSPDIPKPNGKSKEAFGQVAKVKIMESVGELDIPKNVQGKVTSTLARGLELDAILNLQGLSEAETELPSEPLLQPENSSDEIGSEVSVVEEPQVVDLLPTEVKSEQLQTI